jgi:TolA-binding protein
MITRTLKLSFFFLLLSVTGYSTTSQNERLEIMENEIRSVTGKLETLEQRIVELENSKDNNSIRNEAKKLYDEGVIDLKKAFAANNNSKKEMLIESSRKKLNSFLENYPKSDFVPNVYFWLGEIFFHQNNFEKSSKQYLKSYQISQQNPKVGKPQDALLKLAISLGESNQHQEACKILDLLDKEFPIRTSSAKKRSLDARYKYNCQK